MTEHEKQQLVDEGGYEWCEECEGEGQVLEEHIQGWPRYYSCGYCDGEGIVAKEMFHGNG